MVVNVKLLSLLERGAKIRSFGGLVRGEVMCFIGQGEWQPLLVGVQSSSVL